MSQFPPVDLQLRLLGQETGKETEERLYEGEGDERTRSSQDQRLESLAYGCIHFGAVLSWEHFVNTVGPLFRFPRSKPTGFAGGFFRVCDPGLIFRSPLFRD
jgi:hypothetical protein